MEIGAEEKADRCLFWVRDNGSGIEAKYLSKLFTLGTEGRVHRDFARIPGHGYGLHICKTIVAGHGGSIWAESKYGGAFFFRCHPLAKPERIRRPRRSDDGQPEILDRSDGFDEFVEVNGSDVTIRVPVVRGRMSVPSRMPSS
jgi:signal transduction histidine kinase